MLMSSRTRIPLLMMAAALLAVLLPARSALADPTLEETGAWLKDKVTRHEISITSSGDWTKGYSQTHKVTGTLELDACNSTLSRTEVTSASNATNWYTLKEVRRTLVPLSKISLSSIRISEVGP